MKIVLLDAFAANPGDLSWASLEELAEVIIYDGTPEDLIVERIGDAQAVLINKAPITRATLDACPSLRYVGVVATGYNNVDIAAAKERGVTVCNVPAYSTPSVAQMTMALLLEICQHVGHHSQAVHEGRWEECRNFTFWDYPLIELAGKTMGIIGFGQTGRAVGKLSAAFGMRVLATGSHPTDEGRAIGEYVTLDRLLAESDIISLHCPLKPETRGMINRGTIEKMKDGVILLNCSRGPVIVEQDVADALERGKIYFAGVDVVSTEPIRNDNPLLKAKNCFITPHIAWAPRESRARLLDIAIGNFAAWQKGEPQNVVNP
ncbi:MAG TPA: D-2-hydroxyacid dehydrogenase [Oscillospiraceae bacterium]|nr:D-2-hydroxyacid dehydrogenase [Oscillospiraceae bacterium]